MSASVAVIQPRDWQTLGLVPGTALRLFGMRRSGNHAIADWLQRNAETEKSVFFNNCKPGFHPFRKFASIEINRHRSSHSAAVSDLAAATGPAGDGAMLVVSYEDCCPADHTLDHPVSGRFDEALLTGDILIVRSFLNWAASLLKKMQANSNYTLSQRCGVLLRAFATYTRMLDLAAQAADLGLTVIRYDDWSRDAAYREAVLDQLGLAARDNSLGSVQRYGGGSSFQKTAESAAELQTDNRWQQMAQDPEFQSVLHLAARDDALMRQLDQHFPADAARLQKVAAQAPLAPGGLG